MYTSRLFADLVDQRSQGYYESSELFSDIMTKNNLNRDQKYNDKELDSFARSLRGKIKSCKAEGVSDQIVYDTSRILVHIYRAPQLLSKMDYTSCSA